MGRRPLTIALVLAAMLVTPASSSALVWAGSVKDKQDQQESLDGPSEPDIKRVTARYDDQAGKVAVRVTYWAPYDPQGGDAYDHWLSWDVFDCQHGGKGRSVQGYDDAVTVSGYDGQLHARHAWSADHTVLTYRVEHRVLRHRGLGCFHVMLFSEVPGLATDPGSRYDDGCSCWMDSWTPEDIFGELRRLRSL